MSTRATRSRAILPEFDYFSVDFNHFPSNFHYFDFTNVILVAIPMFRVTRIRIVTFRKMSRLPGLPDCAVF